MKKTTREECVAAWVGEELVCAHCLTEEDEEALKGLLSDEELKEASEHSCQRCKRDLGS